MEESKMKIKAIFQFLFLLLLIPCYLIPQQILHEADVRKIMDQIFSQHLEKKEIDAEIIKNSFRNYINQFDPHHIYLLESEVNPYINMDENEIQKVVNDYKNNNFDVYKKLNLLIQKAIQRAQKYRNFWLKKTKNFNQFAPTYQINEANHYQANKNFAKNIHELKDRQKLHLIHFILVASDYPNKITNDEELDFMKKYDNSQKMKESYYLFKEINGEPFSEEKKEDIFTTLLIKSIAKSLDAHTSFLNPNEAFDMRVRLEKGFNGIGILLSKKSNGYEVSKILPGSPAATNGQIAINDLLLKVDGIEVTNEPLNKVMELLRGKNGTTVALELETKRNAEAKKYELTLRREPIVVEEGRAETSYVPFAGGIIGTIRLESFYQGINGISSENDVKKAIKELEKKGPLKGLILDLRENSGGFLNQAVKVAGLFITNGIIVISKYSNGEEKYYRDMDGKVSYEGPMVVLTSKMTASAAEIVAQALQDYGVALVVGDEQTYGKGTIQSQTITEENDAHSYFKVTVGKYYTVSGKTPQLHGVKADIVVPSPYNTDKIGEEYLDYSLRQDNIPEAFIDRLTDIDPSLRPWYLRYYMPTLQKKKTTWREILPQLQKQSRVRLNKEYALRSNGEDPQLNEAINVVKDMVILKEAPLN